MLLTFILVKVYICKTIVHACDQLINVKFDMYGYCFQSSYVICGPLQLKVREATEFTSGGAGIFRGPRFFLTLGQGGLDFFDPPPGGGGS